MPNSNYILSQYIKVSNINVTSKLLSKLALKYIVPHIHMINATLVSNLKQHKKSLHEDVKYECFECELKFTKLDNLKIHIESIHMGVKHQCDECDSKFTQLKKHEKSIHIFF